MPYKERLRAGTAQPGEEMAHRGRYPCAKIPESGTGKEDGHFFQWCPVIGGNQHKMKHMKFHWNKPFLTVGVIKVLELAVQWGCGLSILRRYSKPNWTQPWVTCCSWPCCEQGRWIKWSPMAPANMNYSLILSPPEILSRPSPPMILMSQTVRKYKKKGKRKINTQWLCRKYTLPHWTTAFIDQVINSPNEFFFKV